MKNAEQMAGEIPPRPAAGRLAGKVAIVTGAGAAGDSWGIGRAIACILGREGATIIAVDRDRTSADFTADIIRANGGSADAVEADLLQLSNAQRAAETALERHGRIDVLVNGVGGGGAGGGISTTEAAWRASLDLNLTTAFFASKSVLPAMVEAGRGSIVHIGSMAGVRYPGTPTLAYSVAKAGLLQLSTMIALEFAANGIRSNYLALGHVDTPEIRRRVVERYGAENLDSVMRMRAGVVPQKRNATVWEIADAVLFLASDESSHVTSINLPIDGGSASLSVSSYIAEADRIFEKK